MAKSKTRYVCQTCGSAQSKWMGRCPDCDEWNSLVEMVVQEPPPGRAASVAVATGNGGPQALPDIPADGYERIPVPISEMSRVLGGGIVPGSVVLISGDPGVGKSTLLIQLCHALSGGERPILYVSGEESAAQIKLRAERLGIVSPRHPGVGRNPPGEHRRAHRERRARAWWWSIPFRASTQTASNRVRAA